MSGTKGPLAEGTLEKLIYLSAEGARLKVESLRQKDRVKHKHKCIVSFSGAAVLQ